MYLYLDNTFDYVEREARMVMSVINLLFDDDKS